MSMRKGVQIKNKYDYEQKIIYDILHKISMFQTVVIIREQSLDNLTNYLTRSIV